MQENMRIFAKYAKYAAIAWSL